MYDFTGETVTREGHQMAQYAVQRPGGGVHLRWVDVALLEPHELTALRYAQRRANEALLRELGAA